MYNPGKDVQGDHRQALPRPRRPARREAARGYAGDIVAVIGLKDSVTGDTLCETQHPILLEPITFAEAVVSQSIEPESSADKDKLGQALTSPQARRPDVQGGGGQGHR